jgi:hypothetical protein
MHWWTRQWQQQQQLQVRGMGEVWRLLWCVCGSSSSSSSRLGSSRQLQQYASTGRHVRSAVGNNCRCHRLNVAVAAGRIYYSSSSSSTS